MKITDVEHRVVDIDATRAHAYNQVNVRRLQSGDLVAVYNEERFPYHHDSGQTVLLRSRDDGETWTDRTVVLPYTEETGNWDCGICELEDGTLLVDLTIAGVLQARHPSRAALVDTRPDERASTATGRGATRRWVGSARTCCARPTAARRGAIRSR